MSLAADAGVIPHLALSFMFCSSDKMQEMGGFNLHWAHFDKAQWPPQSVTVRILFKIGGLLVLTPTFSTEGITDWGEGKIILRSPMYDQ